MNLHTLEKIRAEVEKKTKNLVVDNWEDGNARVCNPRCHDSGKESALTDLLTYLDTEIAKAKGV